MYWIGFAYGSAQTTRVFFQMSEKETLDASTGTTLMLDPRSQLLYGCCYCYNEKRTLFYLNSLNYRSEIIQLPIAYARQVRPILKTWYICSLHNIYLRFACNPVYCGLIFTSGRITCTVEAISFTPNRFFRASPVQNGQIKSFDCR